MAVLLATVLLVTVLFPGVALASTGGPSLPWDQPLQNLIGNLTGTVARLLITAAIVISGVMWAFTEHSQGIRRVLQVVMGIGLALAASQVLTGLGFAGAVL
jgi:type IV secretion system protein VirB2